MTTPFGHPARNFGMAAVVMLALTITTSNPIFPMLMWGCVAAALVLGMLSKRRGEQEGSAGAAAGRSGLYLALAFIGSIAAVLAVIYVSVALLG